MLAVCFVAGERVDAGVFHDSILRHGHLSQVKPLFDAAATAHTSTRPQSEKAIAAGNGIVRRHARSDEHSAHDAAHLLLVLEDVKQYIADHGCGHVMSSKAARMRADLLPHVAYMLLVGGIGWSNTLFVTELRLGSNVHLFRDANGRAHWEVMPPLCSETGTVNMLRRVTPGEPLQLLITWLVATLPSSSRFLFAGIQTSSKRGLKRAAN
jgi:hypothetical protein